MAYRRVDPPDWGDRYVETASGKILVPANSKYGRDRAEPAEWLKKRLGSSIGDWGAQDGFSHGLRLDRDSKTLIIRWPEKGGGWDDKVSESIALGEVANAGISPVVHPQLIAILNKQMEQASQADLTLIGRQSTVKKASRSISMFNDSPLGFTAAAAQFLFQMRTYNRGAPVSLLPLHIPAERWAEEGMTIVPMPLEGQSESDCDRFYMEVDWGLHGTPIPHLPCVFDLEATGNNEWPYWYRFEMDDRKCWVLLHNSQIIPVLPGVKNTSRFGTSSVYTMWSILAERVLIEDRRTERQVNALSDGLLGVGGIDIDAGDLREKIEIGGSTKQGNGNVLNKGWHVITAEGQIYFDHFSFRQDDGVDFEKRRQYEEDVLALAFLEPLVALVTRGGIGFGVNSPTAREASSDGGANSVLEILSVVLGAIYQRVNISITRPNDLTKRKRIDAFKEFAIAVKNFNAAFGDGDGGLTSAEARAILNRDVLDIPETGDDYISEHATADEDSDKGDINEDGTNPDDGHENVDDDPALSSELSRIVRYVMGAEYQTYNLASLIEAIDSAQFVALVRLWREAFGGQYGSADLQAIIDGWAEAGIDPASAEEDDILSVVADHTDPIADHADRQSILTAILSLALMGRDQALDDAPEENRLDGDGIDEAGADILDFLTQRLDNLLSGPDDTETPEGEFTADVPNLNRQSYRDVAYAAKQVRDDEIGEDEAGDILDVFADDRSDFVGEVETAQGYGYARWSTSGRMTPLRKEWIRSVAQNPRREHQAHWGQIVDWDEPFASGDTWAGQRIGCLCDTRALWE